MAFEREEVRLPGGVLTYWVAGSGSPLLYIHGGEGAQTSDALARLAQGRRVYVPILPGFDSSDAHKDVRSVRQLAHMLGDFIAAKIGGACDVIGFSFGGWVALWLAADKPNSVDHLILQSPLGFVPEGRDELLGAAGTMAQNRDVLARYAGGTADDLMPALADITCVTLLLAGASDDVARPETVRLLKSRMPRSYLVYVFDARHAIEVDQPNRFHGVVTDFLTWGEAFLVNRADQRTPFSRAADAAYG